MTQMERIERYINKTNALIEKAEKALKDAIAANAPAEEIADLKVSLNRAYEENESYVDLRNSLEA